MTLIARGLFVFGGAAVGSFLIDRFVFGSMALIRNRSDFGFASPQSLRTLFAEFSDAMDDCQFRSREARAS
jgi:hypothetical protein